MAKTLLMKLEGGEAKGKGGRKEGMEEEKKGGKNMLMGASVRNGMRNSKIKHTIGREEGREKEEERGRKEEEEASAHAYLPTKGLRLSEESRKAHRRPMRCSLPLSCSTIANTSDVSSSQAM